MIAREANFIVTDVETTGAHAEKNRMTEIACVTVNDGEIKSKFSSLINPHQFIPQYIANMTGISNEMAFRAPESSDILPEVRSIFDQDTPVFVAHNVKFDWGFIQASLKRDSLPELDMPMLCTLKLARKMLPKDIKKNVGALADYFGITVRGRHRALGDAEATAYILIELLDILEMEHDIQDLEEILEYQNKVYRNYRIGINAIDKFKDYSKHAPLSPGVIYFNDSSGNTLYLRQTDNIKLKLAEYANAGKVSSKKLADIISAANMLNWETAPNVLASHVLHKREIAKLNPQYNPSVSRRMKYIAFSDDDFPRIIKCSDYKQDSVACFGPFESNFAMDKTIDNINKRFKLRECNFELDPSEDFEECYFYDMKRCHAPCSKKQSKDEYKHEVDKVIKYLNSVLNTKELQESIELILKNNSESTDIKNEIKKLNYEMKNGSNSFHYDANMIYIETDFNDINTIDVYFIRRGRLEETISIGRKAPIDVLVEPLKHIYFNGSHNSFEPRESDLEEYSVISKWITKNGDHSTVISANYKNEEELLKELEYELKTFEY
jgi:DNA polymerase-3 subunit epsilon